MLIECLIEREGATHVTVAGFNYVFAPDEQGRQVCEVLSHDHQGWFLSMPSSYRPYDAALGIDTESASAARGRKRKAE